MSTDLECGDSGSFGAYSPDLPGCVAVTTITTAA
ncbi:type II toxin-antitoxin system HicB family antitoxin [Pseudonocardia spinosispora]